MASEPRNGLNPAGDQRDRDGPPRPAAPIAAPGARPETARDEAEAWLVYDGECPFCSRYVRYVRVREAVGRLHLVNARDGGPLVDEMVGAGLDLDEGMVLKMGGRYYHGADCIHALALLSGGSGTFNRINAAIFRSRALSRVLYPVLRAGRNAVLRGLGRSKIKAADLD